MQKLIVLFKIASRACNDKILRAIRPATGKRHHVIYMILGYLFMTIIAFSLLAIVLGLDILFSKCSTCSLFKSPAIALMNSMLFTGSNTISHIYFRMSFPVFPIMHIHLFSVVPIVLFVVFWMLFVVGCSFLFTTFLAMMTQPIFSAFIPVEVDRRPWVPICARGASLITDIAAYVTQGIQVACISSVCSKVGRSCRVLIAALWALLQRGIFWYDVTHDGRFLSVITPWDAGNIAGAKPYSNLTLPLYRKTAPEATLHALFTTVITTLHCHYFACNNGM